MPTTVTKERRRHTNWEVINFSEPKQFKKGFFATSRENTGFSANSCPMPVLGVNKCKWLKVRGPKSLFQPSDVKYPT